MTPDVAFDPDIVYATHDGIELLGDLYRPKLSASAPIIVAVHGGAWETGSRSHFRWLAPWLATRGIACFAINYRLAKPSAPAFPQAVHDVMAAVKFVTGKAEEFGVARDRIGLLGASAGAHLAALAALAHGEADFKDGYPADEFASQAIEPKVLIGVYGIYDMVEMWHHAAATRPLNNIVEKFLGTSPMKNRRLYFDSSPMSYATVSNNNVAVFLSSGTEDDIVNRHPQSEAFRLALSQAGFFVRNCIVQGAPHLWIVDPIDEPGSHSEFFAVRMLRFLREKL